MSPFCIFSAGAPTINCAQARTALLLITAVVFIGCGSQSTNDNSWSSGTTALSLYAVNTYGPATDSFKADTSSGMLSGAGTSQANAANPVDAVASANGKFLYVISGGSDQLAVYSIGTDGSLGVAYAQAAQGLVPAGARLIARAGNRIFIAGLQSLAVMTIQDTTGAVVPVYTAHFTAASAAHAMVVDPEGKFVYVLHDQIGYGAAPLSVFSVNASTAETLEIPGSPFTSIQGPAGKLAIDRTGAFLYATTYTALGAPLNDRILSFQIGSNGIPAQVASLATDWGPANIAIDATNGVLYVAYGSATPAVKSFLTHSDGSLTATGSSLSLTTPPWDLALDPSGQFLFASAQGRGGILAAKITTAGSLTLVSGSPFATGVDYLALEAVRH